MSLRVEDQTASAWRFGLEANSPLKACFAGPEPGHRMVSIKTGSTGIPFVERCERCGWIDPVALDHHVDNAIKINATARAQRIAVAAETEPFRFVQAPGQDLDTDEIILQSLGAAHLLGVMQGPVNASDGRRMTHIFKSTKLEIERKIRMASERKS